MGRAPCCDKANVKRGPWSPEEDANLKDYIEKHGTGGNWIALPQKAGLRRCGKSCRLRWLNYLRPNIKHGEFSDDEDRIICTLFASIGSRWSIIAAQLPGRTDNDIKNYWNTKLKKKILMGTNSLMLPPYHHHKIKPPTYQSSNSLTLYPSSSSPPSYSSPSPTFKYSNSYNYSSNLATASRLSFTGNYDQTMLSNNNIPYSNLVLNLQTTPDGFVGPMQNSYQGKDSSSPLIVFGDHQAAASCTSSDGSNKDQVEYEQFMLFSNGGGGNIIIDGNNNINPAKQINNGLLFNGGHHQTPLDDHHYNTSTLEEIKQLISTNGISCNSNLNFFVDENKATTHDDDEEKVMLYY